MLDQDSTHCCGIQDSSHHLLFCVAGAASSDRPDQQPLTRLLIAGVSVAVTTSQAPANAANDTACKEGFSMQESACCMAASSSQHWEQVHVLLRQWQCGVDVWQVTSSCTQQTSKHQTSAVIVKRMGRMDRSAMFVRFRAPSAAQVSFEGSRQA